MVIEENSVSLIRLVLTIYSSGGSLFPVVLEDLCVFVVLTEVRGPGTFWLEIVQADTDETIFSTKRRLVDFESDPLMVHGLPFRMKNCEFPSPGLYWIQFWFEDSNLAQQDLFVG